MRHAQILLYHAPKLQGFDPDEEYVWSLVWEKYLKAKEMAGNKKNS
jgi:hypothetical protein